jgi:hypothetical protein
MSGLVLILELGFKRHVNNKAGTCEKKKKNADDE